MKESAKNRELPIINAKKIKAKKTEIAVMIFPFCQPKTVKKLRTFSFLSPAKSFKSLTGRKNAKKTKTAKNNIHASTSADDEVGICAKYPYKTTVLSPAAAIRWENKNLRKRKTLYKTLKPILIAVMIKIGIESIIKTRIMIASKTKICNINISFLLKIPRAYGRFGLLTLSIFISETSLEMAA